MAHAEDGPTAVVLSSRDLRQLLDFNEVLPIVKEAFVALSEDRSAMFRLIRETLGANVMFGLRSGWWPDRRLLGLKVSGYYPDNAHRRMDRHQACVVLVDPDCGRPLAFVNGNAITRIRTAAAGAIGSVTLARPDACKILIIGSGVQAEEQIMSHARVFADRDPQFRLIAPRKTLDSLETAGLVARLGARGIQASGIGDLAAALTDADLVVTTTAARSPIVEQDVLAPGTHITAIGADAPGKRELDDSVIENAEVFVDDLEQALENGESQYLSNSRRGGIRALGDVLRGAVPGRADDEEITVFDSTGLSVHDLAVAAYAVGRARRERLGTPINI
jgi:ornithine cyclodeaminase/alanine dehydrogenase-like protein (mu-crystallin family)